MRPAVQTVLCQCRTTLALMLQTLSQGMSQGWSSPGVSKLTDGKGPFVPTTDEVSWIVSLFELGLMFGSVVSFFVFANAGRRYTLVVAPLAFAVWIILTYFATSSPYLYVARIFAGIGMGVNFTFSSIYIGEVTTPLMRGVLILVMTLLAPLGQLLAFVVGPYVTYWQEALVPVPFVVLSILCSIVWTQETPFYLTMLDRHDDALCELTRLRQGRPVEQILEEAAEIQRSVRQQQEDATTWWETFSPPGAKRAAIVVLVLSGSPALFGVDSVLSYTQEIFKVADTPLSKPVSSMLVIGVKVVMIVVAMYLIERLGRRPQLFVTALINALAMVAMSGYFLVKEHLNMSVSNVKWLPLVALMTFMAATGGGVIPVSHVLMGELLSQRAKKIVAPMAAVILSGTSFGISKSFLPLGDSVGFCVPFGVFALTNLFIAIFTIFFVPETKGKTLVEVQDDLSRRSGYRADSQPMTSDKERIIPPEPEISGTFNEIPEYI